MRRKIAMIAVLGGLAVGFGCHHIGGKQDCGYHPSDYPIRPVSAPYAVSPVPGLPPKDAADPGPIPKSKDVGSDKDVKPPEVKGDN